MGDAGVVGDVPIARSDVPHEPAMDATTVDEFRAILADDPDVMSAAARPQPGPGDTWAMHGGNKPTPER